MLYIEDSTDLSLYWGPRFCLKTKRKGWQEDTGFGVQTVRICLKSRMKRLLNSFLFGKVNMEGNGSFFARGNIMCFVGIIPR